MLISVLEGTISLEKHEKTKASKWPPPGHVVSEVVKNVVLLQKTSGMVFYTTQATETMWYHFSNCKHFLNAKIMMTSLARSWQRK